MSHSNKRYADERSQEEPTGKRHADAAYRREPAELKLSGRYDVLQDDEDGDDRMSGYSAVSVGINTHAARSRDRARARSRSRSVQSRARSRSRSNHGGRSSRPGLRGNSQLEEMEESCVLSRTSRGKTRKSRSKNRPSLPYSKTLVSDDENMFSQMEEDEIYNIRDEQNEKRIP